ncbi:BTAD domain-containing putative transcriptional regulator [Actinoplanes sp. NPDC051851]|uniref:AfsR/SARP family transcriptional regulator n=1 Tax=Actinoplanes sp. NPDC051851 TaxID=3154753 RepID=UPI0034189528
MRYRILGPLSVAVEGRPVAVTAGRDRVVLTMLLLNPGRIVGAGELIDAVWGSRPPATARNQLQTCISRLRRIMPVGVILTDRAGYGIQVGSDELDSTIFTRTVEQARVDGDREAYRKALDLWRGPACAEIDAPGVRQSAAVLDEQYALAIEDWADLELAAGRERELIGELGGLVERFPLRERLRGQLMTALARAGRRADALTEFQRASRVLEEELGIEPGPELQEVHRTVLGGPPPVERPPVRCLPRTVHDFTGRRDLIARLAAEIDPTGPAVLVVDGMAGSGKTTLALHLAALVGEDYPDAHLFVDLQGHSEHEPVEPSAALLVLLRQLGLGAESIPADVVGRTALWRTELSRRRALVVLDNAAGSSQVEDLLPTAPGTLALVTSRRRLAGLDGVSPQPVPVLDPDEALTLLERIAGPRVRAEPVAAAEVVRRCGGLPLAVRLAGARLAHRPRWRVADLLDRLGEAALDGLAVENRSVASAFALSYEQLGEPVRRLFRLLGVYPGSNFDAPAAAALTGLPLAGARDLLDELLDGHLIEEPEPGVFRLHDLLREFAAALAADRPEPERREALHSVLNLETHALSACQARTHERMRQVELRDNPCLRPDLLAAIDDPAARLERHRPDLGAFAAAAEASGHPEYAWLLPRAAWYLLYFRGYHEDVRVLQERALAAARAAGDESGMATAANFLASVHYRLAEHERALEHLQTALRIRERRGDPGVGNILGNLATVHLATSRFAEAAETALAARRRMVLDRMRLESPALILNLAVAYEQLGRYPEALRLDRLRLLAAWTAGDLHEVAGCLLRIQNVRLRLGQITPALAWRYAAAALRLTVRLGLAGVEASAHNALARILAEQGDTDRALVSHRRAVEVAARVGEKRAEAEYLHDYAITLLRSGDTGAARDHLEASLRLARKLRLPYSTARALAGLAECAAVRDPDLARELWTEAGELFERMGVPERRDVARRIAAPRAALAVP